MEQEINNVPTLNKEKRTNVSVTRRLKSPVKKERSVITMTEPLPQDRPETPPQPQEPGLKSACRKLTLPLKNKTSYPKTSLVEQRFIFGVNTRKTENDSIRPYIGKEIYISSGKWDLSTSTGFDMTGFYVINMQNAVIESAVETVEQDRYIYTTEQPVTIQNISFLLTAAEYEKIKTVKPDILAVCGILNRIYNPIRSLPEIIQLHRFF